jgi:hypothetical protein
MGLDYPLESLQTDLNPRILRISQEVSQVSGVERVLFWGLLANNRSHLTEIRGGLNGSNDLQRFPARGVRREQHFDASCFAWDILDSFWSDSCWSPGCLAGR